MWCPPRTSVTSALKVQLSSSSLSSSSSSSPLPLIYPAIYSSYRGDDAVCALAGQVPGCPSAATRSESLRHHPGRTRRERGRSSRHMSRADDFSGFARIRDRWAGGRRGQGVLRPRGRALHAQAAGEQGALPDGSGISPRPRCLRSSRRRHVRLVGKIIIISFLFFFFFFFFFFSSSSLL